jgi:hypothetical protein
MQANREAPTVRFTSARNEVSEAASSTAALVDGFTPNTGEAWWLCSAERETAQIRTQGATAAKVPLLFELRIQKLEGPCLDPLLEQHPCQQARSLSADARLLTHLAAAVPFPSLACRCLTPDDPDGLEAQVAALLGAAGSLSAHAMAEADEALAPKVRRPLSRQQTAGQNRVNSNNTGLVLTCAGAACHLRPLTLTHLLLPAAPCHPLQKFTSEEAAERAARLSKMRNLLFYAEQKAKRLAKIKSKEYHRCVWVWLCLCLRAEQAGLCWLPLKPSPEHFLTGSSA